MSVVVSLLVFLTAVGVGTSSHVTGFDHNETAFLVVSPANRSEYKNAIRAGSRMSFVCAAWGEPSPVSITWYNTTGGVLQTQAEDINIYEEDVTADGFTYKISILELCNAKDEHEGSYTCVASNGISDEELVDGVTYEYNFELRRPIVDIAPHTIVLMTNDAVNVTCNTSFDDIVWTLWLKDGSYLPIEEGMIFSVISGTPERLEIETDCYSFITEWDAIECSLRNSLNDSITLAYDRASVYLVEEDLTITFDSTSSGSSDEVSSQTTLVIDHNDDVTLKCYGTSGNYNLTWYTPGGETVTSEYVNIATLQVPTFKKEDIGYYRCKSQESGLDSEIKMVIECPEEVDSTYDPDITWAATLVCINDSQPCPRFDGIDHVGYVIRYCDDEAKWNDSFDASKCERKHIFELQTMFEEYLESPTEAELELLMSTIRTHVQTEQYDFSDFSFQSTVYEDLLAFLSRNITVTNDPATLSRLLDIFCFFVNNAYLQEDPIISQTFLNISQVYADYAVRLLVDNDIPNVIIPLTCMYAEAQTLPPEITTDIVFPTANTETVSGMVLGGSVLFLAPVLQMASAIVSVFHTRLGEYLSRDSLQNMTKLGSIVITAQMLPSSSSVGLSNEAVDENAYVELEFLLTESALSMEEIDLKYTLHNPTCACWTENGWSYEEVETTSATKTGDLSYTVVCRTNLTTLKSVGVIVEVGERIIELEVYIGLGISLFFFATTAMLLLIVCTAAKCCKTVIGLHTWIHLNMCFALFGAYAVFLGGIYSTDNAGVCTAVSALLHFFFSAAFTWVMFMALGIFSMPCTNFEPCSRSCVCSSFIFFLLGWVLPVVPMAITLGVHYDSYGDGKFCWVSLGDSEIDLSGRSTFLVLVAFVAPLTGFGLVSVLFCSMATCSIWYGNKGARFDSSLKSDCTRACYHMLVYTLMVGLLCASWVFGVFYINSFYYELSKRLFIGFSIALGVLLFLWNLITVIVDQVEYSQDDGFDDHKTIAHQPSRGMANPWYKAAVPDSDKKAYKMEDLNAQMAGAHGGLDAD